VETETANRKRGYLIALVHYMAQISGTNDPFYIPGVLKAQFKSNARFNQQVKISTQLCPLKSKTAVH
jgi:hypothetical protein